MACDIVSSLVQALVAVWASDTALVSLLEVLATGVCTTVGGDVVTSAGELGRATGAVIAGLGSSLSGGSICRAAH
jgi:lipid-binding SYLF domain-containing protein